MRYVFLSMLPILVTMTIGCAKQAPRAPWPAQVTEWKGFSDDEKTSLQTGIDSLNDHSKETLVQDKAPNNYPVTIEKVAASTWPAGRAGYATVSNENCLVQISDDLMKPEMKDYVMPVVWHELGHCAGLVHVADQGEIMSPVTGTMGTYTSDEISKFMDSIKKAAGL